MASRRFSATWRRAFRAGRGEVLIEVRSAGINCVDTMRRRNQYLVRQDLPFVPDSEVEGVAAGDRVVSIIGTGGYAEYTVAPAEAIIPPSEKGGELSPP